MLVIINLTYVESTLDCSSSFTGMKLRLFAIFSLDVVCSFYAYDSHVLVVCLPFCIFDLNRVFPL